MTLSLLQVLRCPFAKCYENDVLCCVGLIVCTKQNEELDTSLASMYGGS